jgi:hypothetical protein
MVTHTRAAKGPCLQNPIPCLPPHICVTAGLQDSHFPAGSGTICFPWGEAGTSEGVLGG